MSVEYEYTGRAVSPDLTSIHDDAALDEQIAGCCGVTKTFYMNFVEDENGEPTGEGTVTAIWSEGLCNDCKTAFDAIVDTHAPEA